ncbi:hypothetical protein C7U57_00520 [Pseudomonas sp. R9.37]|nr:hypothetical protein C7U57_00520 [Pseudomonas sp. R9.37]
MSKSFGRRRSKCGSWLACDGGGPVDLSLADPPLSQASQLPQVSNGVSERPVRLGTGPVRLAARSASRLAAQG